MLVLSGGDVRELLPMSLAIEAVEEGFRALGRGTVTIPDRLHIPIAGNAVFLLMPAVSGGERPFLGVKLVSVFPGNPARGLSLIQAAYVLQDGATGETLAVLDARSLTAIRTAATSGVATRWMAKGDAAVVGIFGSGVQARSHLQAIREVAPIREVLVCGRSAENTERFVREAAQLPGIQARAVPAEVIASTAQIVCTCTTSTIPVFDGRLIQPGVHINAVGTFQPEARELDGECVRRSRVIIDSHTAAGREAGELLIPLREGLITPEHILGELSDVVLGKVVARRSPADVTLFKSAGHAIEDLVCAVRIYDRARERGLGVTAAL